jgi:hypothetical protein
VSGLEHFKARLRDRAEHHLRIEATRRLGAGKVPSTVKPYDTGGDQFWRRVFVPLYRRLPWKVKQRAMTAARMTARGWTPPERRPGEPWEPPRGDRGAR